MKSSNIYSNINTSSSYYDETERATYKGVAIKTLFLLAITAIIAIVTGLMLPKIVENEKSLMVFIILLIVGAVVGFICAIVGRFSEKAAKYCSVIYSLCEGISLGAITAIVELYVKGAGWIAVCSTLAIFGVMLILYATGVIRATSRLTKIMLGLTFALIAVSIITVIVSFLITDVRTYLGIMIALEAFFLLYGIITLTFNFEEAAAVVQSGCSKNAEWSVALGMEISFVYIYVQILRLLLYIAQFANSK